jgi:hypothetical protein
MPYIPPVDKEEDETRTIDFYPEIVTQEIGMPLFFVCQEARQEAQSWLKTHKFKMRYILGKFPYHGGIFEFTRRMDEDDTLYIPTDKISVFGDDHDELWDELHDGQFHVHTYFGLNSVALPENFFHNDEYFPAPFSELYEVNTIYVVRGEQPDGKDGVWDVVPKGCGSVVWTVDQGFAMKGGEGGEDEDLLRKILKDTKSLGDALQCSYELRGNYTVEILPAVAVRKWTN